MDENMVPEGSEAESLCFDLYEAVTAAEDTKALLDDPRLLQLKELLAYEGPLPDLLDEVVRLAESRLMRGP
jgi:hypothetical protein